MKVLVVGAGAAGLFAAYFRGNAYRSQGHGCREKRKSGKKNLHNGQGTMQPHQPVHAARIS